MSKTSFERHNHSQRGEHSQRVPPAPPPSAASARDGVELGRERARRYLPDLVDLLAAIALGSDSEAPLHSRMMSAKAIVDLAGSVPQPIPTLPPGAADGRPQAGEQTFAAGAERESD
jgi:hypothetical protein